ncbi:MAG: hypothetical protein COT84_08560 [Chlamydiae bacterium CG10_big_fil_rev_8_21_14_0_10_35_9]|nr:MAG: hypothetical protein COT84_08560 [Chlamydiae bacterium CG10_big_fil_rev_8_21_14_0_10_35_9]
MYTSPSQQKPLLLIWKINLEIAEELKLVEVCDQRITRCYSLLRNNTNSNTNAKSQTMEVLEGLGKEKTKSINRITKLNSQLQKLRKLITVQRISFNAAE